MEPLSMLILAAYSAYQTFAKKNKEVTEKKEEDYIKSVLEKRRSYLHSSESITNNKCCELEEEKPKKRNKICEK